MFSGQSTLMGDAMDLLGLSWKQADALFYGHNQGKRDLAVDLRDVTPQQAAGVIRNMIKTGIVKWVEEEGA